VDTEELEAQQPQRYGWGVCTALGFLKSLISSFVLLTLRERLLWAFKLTDLLPTGCLIIVGDKAYHSCVVSKFNDGVLLFPARKPNTVAQTKEVGF
jgi:hypothetical protein